MTSRKSARGSGAEPAADRDSDPRFRRLCETLAAEPRYANAVAEFRARRTSGSPHRFGANALRVHGKIFAMMAQGTLVVKLRKARVDELVEQGLGTRFDPGHGRMMKEWFVASSPKNRWADLAREAHDFVAKPAATARD